MKKKIIICFFVIFIVICIAIFGWDLYVEEGTTNSSLEIRVPMLTRKEKVELKSKDFFDNEELKKIYLSKRQSKKILDKIKKNSNWVSGELNEIIDEKIKIYTREEIYNQIPYIENKYWIFTNRSNKVKDKHSIEELINNKYYAISLGIFDIDNNILYYYQYDR